MYQVEKPLSVCWYYPSKILIYHMTHPTPFGKCIMISIQIFSSLSLPLVGYLQRTWSYCNKNRMALHFVAMYRQMIICFIVFHTMQLLEIIEIMCFGFYSAILLFFHFIYSFLLSLVYHYDQETIHFVSFSIKRNRLFFFCNIDGCKTTTSLNCLPNYSKI